MNNSKDKINPEEVRAKAKTEAEFNRLNELGDIRIVLSTKSGKKFVKRILDKAGIFSQSFCRTESDKTAFNEGRRALGLWLLSELTEAEPKQCTIPLFDEI